MIPFRAAMPNTVMKPISEATESVPPAASTPPPPPGGAVAQAVSSPNTITGYQQTRNSGKLGRVTWREIFRQ